DETGCNAQQWHCDVCGRYTRAARRAKKPAAQRGWQCLNRKRWQIAPPIVEQPPIWLVPRASLGIPTRRLLAIRFLLGPLGIRKVRKVRKVGMIGGWGAVIPRYLAIRQIRVRLFLAGPYSALDGFHRGAVAMLAQIFVCIAGIE